MRHLLAVQVAPTLLVSRALSAHVSREQQQEKLEEVWRLLDCHAA